MPRTMPGTMVAAGIMRMITAYGTSGHPAVIVYMLSAYGTAGRVFDTCQKYKTLQTAEMRAFLCQILFIFMLYGVVLYAIIRYEALVR